MVVVTMMKVMRLAINKRVMIMLRRKVMILACILLMIKKV
jgi:hypothetical protein